MNITPGVPGVKRCYGFTMTGGTGGKTWIFAVATAPLQRSYGHPPTGLRPQARRRGGSDPKATGYEVSSGTGKRGRRGRPSGRVACTPPVFRESVTAGFLALAFPAGYLPALEDYKEREAIFNRRLLISRRSKTRTWGMPRSGRSFRLSEERTGAEEILAGKIRSPVYWSTHRRGSIRRTRNGKTKLLS